MSHIPLPNPPNPELAQNLMALAAGYQLGQIDSRTLVRIALRLLEEEGDDSPEVIELATLRYPTLAEAGPLFTHICKQRLPDYPWPPQQAVLLLVRHLLQQIRLAFDRGGTDLYPLVRRLMMETFYPFYPHQHEAAYVGELWDFGMLFALFHAYDDFYGTDHELEQQRQEWAAALSREVERWLNDNAKREQLPVDEHPRVLH